MVVVCGRLEPKTGGVGGGGGDVENVGGGEVEDEDERGGGREGTVGWLLLLLLLLLMIILLMLQLLLANVETVRTDFVEYAGRRVKGRMVLEVRYRKSEKGEATVIPTSVLYHAFERKEILLFFAVAVVVDGCMKEGKKERVSRMLVDVVGWDCGSTREKRDSKSQIGVRVRKWTKFVGRIKKRKKEKVK